MRRSTPQDIGARLAHIRAAVSQQKHAEALGVPLRTYQNYERGEREPDLRTYLALLDRGWNLAWVLTGEGPEKSENQVTPASQPVKQETLTIAIQLAEEALAQRNGTLSPPDKAELVMLLYDLLEEGLPEAKVLNFARRAAA